MPTDPKFLEWTFPVAGIDRQEEFQEQPALTTPVAKNVRAFEPSSDRGRGGSRPGISKYLTDQLPSGSNVIQHLKVIVDPQGPLLGLSFTPGDTTTTDTSDGGRAVLDNGETRVIRVGGSGFYTHPEAPQDEEPDDEETTVELLQSKAAAFGGGTDVRELTLTDDVENNSIVIVVIGQATTGGSGSGVSVTNGAGNAYTRVGAGGADDGYAISVDDTNAELRCSMWWKQVSGASADDKVIRVTPAGSTFVTIYAGEFKNLDVSTPVRDFAISYLDTPPNNSTVPGPFSASVDYTEKDLIVRVFRETGFSVPTGYAITGFNGDYLPVVANPGGTFQGSVVYSVNAEAASESFTLTHGDPGSDPDRAGYVFMAVSFQWSGA